MGSKRYLEVRKISVNYTFSVLLALTIMIMVAGVPAHGAPKRHKQEVSVDTTVFTRVAQELQEVVVRPKKEKYSKKNNPAVDLMERIRAGRDLGNPTRQPYYSFNQYDKIILGLNDFETDFKPGKRLAFLKEYADTAPTTRKSILNLSLKEKYSTTIRRRKPGARKEIVRGVRSVGIDESFDQENIRKMLEDVLRPTDVYSNDIVLMQNRFVSPLSAIGADYYKYFITDTVSIDDKPYVELSFAPRSPESFSFNGKMFVDTSDSTLFIRRINMRVPRVINLNYVDNIFITQEFMKDSLGNRHKVIDDMSLELQLAPGTPSFYGRRLSLYDGFSYDKNEELADYYDKMAHSFDLSDAKSGCYGLHDAEDWSHIRLRPLSRQEVALDSLMHRMRKMPLFYWGEKALKILATGYVGTTRDGSPSKFNIGPVNTFLSFGDVEGIRLRFGGMTTAALNPHWFARGYAAYGTKDRKWKYHGELEYSFIEKKKHSREFPMNSFRITHEYDLDRIGQHYLFTNPDNFFLSLKRMKSNLAVYRRLSELEYNLELQNNFSIAASLRNEILESTPWVRFEDSEGRFRSRLPQSSATLTLRYAPGEVFAQTSSNRLPINMDAPIFTLSHEFAPKGSFGNRFTINKTEITAQKRFWLSSFGYIDAMVKGGVVWSAVAFPSLLWPNSNLSYTIQPESYSLLNPMEFANDRYASLDFTYWMNGAIFNRLPLIKRLKLREIFSFKALVGGLSDKNNPAKNSDLYRFPQTGLCRIMDKTPYMEIGAGIDNIFTILRVDYIWRLTYRHTPDAPDGGLRVSLHFSF